MDCAEGSYGQIFDHFETQERTNDVLLKTNIVFITHIHGDHQLGILKILQERDNLFSKNPELAIKHGKIYVVTPTPMLEFLDFFIKETMKRIDMIVLVPSIDLNPEQVYYY